ncbi:hypothetical protein MSP8886_02801 [Marinomonas spartinae]|uniref:Uncharacterized protein n=1 Tax=Marinomonas spartinae TaxID=1792290 RepID=A0A1A8TKS9_9GAMM|nr:hypothetical protein [Marinomonas spartinae]SBS33577.1 hypothetical protein MSP8886_02801 [Marinomonas spartinae]
MEEIVSKSMCRLERAVELLKNGQLDRCEFRRSIDDIAYLNLVIISGHGGQKEYIIENDQGSCLNILTYDQALSIALKIGFAPEQIKINLF